MNAYDVFVEPTAVSACVACHFISASERHLIVAKHTVLEVFRVVGKLQDHRLSLVASFKLQGEVTDLKAIRTAENRHLDYVLVSTKSAKVSCIRWNHARHSIATVSLHYYEHTLQNLMLEHLDESVMVVDSPRPLMCLRKNNLLVFLPFQGEDDEDDDEPVIANGTAEKDKIQEPDKSQEHDLTQDQDTAAVSVAAPFFSESTIVDAATFDPEIGEVIDLQFLPSHREPTVVVLSQTRGTWAGLLPQVKDTVTFTVWSLDVATQQATTITKIEHLPYDLYRVVPLFAPLNGCLLIGCNEIVHADNGGIARYVALNSCVADITTSVKSYHDQSALELKLEGCSVAPIPNDNKILLTLVTGAMYVISFEVDGKTIKRLSVVELPKANYELVLFQDPGPVAAITDTLLFLGGRTCDSLLVEVAYESAENGAPLENPAPADDDDELMLYDDEKPTVRSRDGQLTLIKRDALMNLGPIPSFVFGKTSTEKFVANLPNPSFNEVSIFAAGGVGALGLLNILTPTVQPIIQSSLRFSQLTRLWILNHKYLVTSDDKGLKSEIFDIPQSYARLQAKSFIHNEFTLAMYELENGNFLLQVTTKQVILFNNKFKHLASLEEQLKENADAYIVNSVFNDDILMVFLSNGEVVIYSINTYNKTFTKVELPKLLSDTLITTGYISNSKLLYHVQKDLGVLIKGQKRKRDAQEPEAVAEESQRLKLFVLVTGDNRVVVFSRYHNEKCFQLNSTEKFTDVLQLGFFDINGSEPDPSIKQVILNDLGDEYDKEEYLTILTIGGEIYNYKLYFDGENFSFRKQANLPITGAPRNANSFHNSIERRMVYMPNFSGVTCIMITGEWPYMLTAPRRSSLKIFKFSKIPIVSFGAYSDLKISNGMIYIDTEKNARIAELPSDFSYDHNWPVKRISIGETIKSLAYHETSHTVVLSTFKEVPYECVDDEGNPIVGIKPEKPLAITYQGQIQLISPISWTPIDTIALGPNQVGLTLKSMILDVGSENKRFKTKKEFVLVGAGQLRIEDMVCNGSYLLLEIIDIIPEPGKPETNHKFKTFAREETKGAVTAISEVSGRFLISQGQKIIVRDIKDNSAVPVAFLDMALYVSEAKSFGNLMLFGDSLKSVQLAGFDAEPFRVIALSKDLHGYDVACADFIVKDEELFIAVADNERNLHVLQYNPEDPASANGQRLLLKSSFTTNFNTVCMRAIPKHENVQWVDQANTPLQAVSSTTEGAMYTVFPVNEATYRRMYIMQQQLTDKEFHHCGLNPRLNRTGKFTGEQKLQPVLDGELIRRYAKLNEDRMRQIGNKISVKGAVEIWNDLMEFQTVLSEL